MSAPARAAAAAASHPAWPPPMTTTSASHALVPAGVVNALKAAPARPPAEHTIAATTCLDTTDTATPHTPRHAVGTAPSITDVHGGTLVFATGVVAFSPLCVWFLLLCMCMSLSRGVCECVCV